MLTSSKVRPRPAEGHGLYVNVTGLVETEYKRWTGGHSSLCPCGLNTRQHVGTVLLSWMSLLGNLPA